MRWSPAAAYRPTFRPAAGHGGGGCLADGAERDQRQPGAAGSASAGNWDAMLDTHFMLGDARLGIAADPDLLPVSHTLARGMGAQLVAAVVLARAPVRRCAAGAHPGR